MHVFLSAENFRYNSIRDTQTGLLPSMQKIYISIQTSLIDMQSLNRKRFFFGVQLQTRKKTKRVLCFKVFERGCCLQVDFCIVLIKTSLFMVTGLNGRKQCFFTPLSVT